MPGAFPFFNCRVACLISCFDGLSALMRSGVSAGGISGGSSGEGRFSSSSKYSFHRLNWSAWFVNTCPFLSITYCSSLRRVPASFRVMLYNSFRFICPAVSSAVSLQSLSCQVLNFFLPPC